MVLWDLSQYNILIKFILSLQIHAIVALQLEVGSGTFQGSGVKSSQEVSSNRNDRRQLAPTVSAPILWADLQTI